MTTAERRTMPRVQWENKLSMTSYDGYHLTAISHDLSFISAQVRLDRRSAFLLSPSGNAADMMTSIHPVKLHLSLPVHGELFDIQADCAITGFRFLSDNEVAVTLRFNEYIDQCDDQLRYFIESRLAEEIFGSNPDLSSRRPVSPRVLQQLLSLR